MLFIISADVIPPKRKRKIIVTQTPDKLQTFETQKPANQTILAEPVQEQERKYFASTVCLLEILIFAMFMKICIVDDLSALSNSFSENGNGGIGND